MKKLFITIVMVFMAMVGYAQTTFNVRAGGGFFSKLLRSTHSIHLKKITMVARLLLK